MYFLDYLGIRFMLQRQAIPSLQQLRSACRLSGTPAFLGGCALSLVMVLGAPEQSQAQDVILDKTWEAPGQVARSQAEAPEAVQQALEQWESAANGKNLRALFQGYSSNYRNSDGLNRRALATSIRGFWKQYPALSYKTEIVDWKKTRRGGIAEVVTRIEGSRNEDSRRLDLASTLRTRQTYEKGQLVREEILSERSEVTSGDRPPTLQVNLPERVKPGQKYNFDVIVLEPLETDLLLGGLLDEPVSPKGYGNPSEAELAPLVDSQTGTGPGGIFKIGEAPRQESDRWISAVVMRKDGLTMVTQRLKVAKR